jgi:hypothetical protein
MPLSEQMDRVTVHRDMVVVEKAYASAAREKGKTYSMDRVARDYAALYESMLAERVH